MKNYLLTIRLTSERNPYENLLVIAGFRDAMFMAFGFCGKVQRMMKQTSHGIPE